MKEALAKFKGEDSFGAAQDLALPVFDPNTINSADIEEATEGVIAPFVHMRTEIKKSLGDVITDLSEWQKVVSDLMVTASASFGAALVTGDFDEVGKAIVRQLGGIAIQVGAALIAMGVPQAAVGLPTGFGYIAAGSALAILGGAMQATGTTSSDGGGGSMSGGGGGGSMGGGYAPAINGGQNNFSFDGVVRGSNLEIVLLNTNKQNRRIR